MTIRTANEQAIKHNFIAGEWRPSSEYMENINPSDTNDVIARYAIASSNDVQDSVSAAVTAMPVWSGSTSGERFEILDAIGSEIIQRKNELGDLLAREEGKTLKEAVAEAHRAGSLFKFFAAEVYRAEVEGYRSLRQGISLEVRREPIGVVAAITPWNFPLAIPAWKIAPALAYGNTVVFKPAELVSGSAWVLAEIISRAGLPEGVFNLVMGRGTEVGAALVEHADVAGVTLLDPRLLDAKLVRLHLPVEVRCSWKWAVRTHSSCLMMPTLKVLLNLPLTALSILLASDVPHHLD